MPQYTTSLRRVKRGNTPPNLYPAHGVSDCDQNSLSRTVYHDWCQHGLDVCAMVLPIGLGGDLVDGGLVGDYEVCCPS